MKATKLFLGAAITCISLAACTDSNTKQSGQDTIMANPDTSNMTQPSENPATMPMDTLNKDTLRKDTAKKIAKGDRKSKITIKTYDYKQNNKMEADPTGVYGYAEVMPSFPGGEKAMNKWLENNLKYPESAVENDISGDVLVTFAVDENGKVYTPKVISTPLGYGLEEEATAVVNKMPKWNPGRIKGKNVKTKFTLPVSFQLL